jgi:hypothetical protein
MKRSLAGIRHYLYPMIMMQRAPLFHQTIIDRPPFVGELLNVLDLAFTAYKPFLGWEIPCFLGCEP